MNHRRIVVGVVLLVFGAAALQADAKADDLSGTCRIGMSEKSGDLEVKLERSNCKYEEAHWGNSQTNEPLSAFTGITVADLSRDGAQLNAVLAAEAGTLRCAGTVHDAELVGDF